MIQKYAKLAGKVAVVTGANRGIGRAISEALAKHGASVIVCCKERLDSAAQVVNDLDISNVQKHLAVQLDVTDRQSIRQAIEQISAVFAEINILVNNAGINRPNDFDMISDAEWDEVLGINLTGVFKTTQEFLPHLKDGGSIISISSVSGQYGGPRTTHYAVSKAALLSLTHNLAIFCATRNIRVNVVAPGLIESKMASAAKGLGLEEKILLKRLGRSAEIAEVVAFLASDEASYITAQTINVNGGLYF